MSQRPPLCAVSTELNLVIRRPLLFGKTMAGGDAVTVDDARSVLRSPKLPRCPIVGSEIAVAEGESHRADGVQCSAGGRELCATQSECIGSYQDNYRDHRAVEEHGTGQRSAKNRSRSASRRPSCAQSWGTNEVISLALPPRAAYWAGDEGAFPKNLDCLRDRPRAYSNDSVDCVFRLVTSGGHSINLLSRRREGPPISTQAEAMMASKLP
jgi:hypothetical protein